MGHLTWVRSSYLWNKTQTGSLGTKRILVEFLTKGTCALTLLAFGCGGNPTATPSGTGGGTGGEDNSGGTLQDGIGLEGIGSEMQVARVTNPCEGVLVTEGTQLPPAMVYQGVSGPGLYESSQPSAASYGYLKHGMAVRTVGAVEQGRVRVVIDGPLKTRGWTRAQDLGAVVAQKGRIPGTPVSVAAGDVLCVLGPMDGRDGIYRVAATPTGLDGAERFEGIYPASRLGGSGVRDSTQPTTHHLPVGSSLTLVNKPSGDPVAVVAAGQAAVPVEVVRQSGDWRAVRIGNGPTLVGYLGPHENLVSGGRVTSSTAAGSDPEDNATRGIPASIQREESYPMVRVAEGTRVKFRGRTVAILKSEAVGRELQRYDSGEVDVYLAVDPDVTVRGMVAVDSLAAY